MIQSVDRAIQVLGVLAAARRVSLSEIAGRLGLAPSTVHGIIKTLQARGLVLQDRASGRYRLGPAVLKLGNVYLDTLELRSSAFGWARELARDTGFAVRTGVLLPGEVMIVHHEPPPGAGRGMPEDGIAIPVHASALGKAILAFAPEQAEALLREQDALYSMTRDTVTDPARFRALLDDVRAHALAAEQEEAVIGECGLAAPVFDDSPAVVGAIGVVVPMSAWPVARSVADAVRHTARAISRELRAPAWPVHPEPAPDPGRQPDSRRPG